MASKKKAEVKPEHLFIITIVMIPNEVGNKYSFYARVRQLALKPVFVEEWPLITSWYSVDSFVLGGRDIRTLEREIYTFLMQEVYAKYDHEKVRVSFKEY